ncbi:ferric reductase transmembrane component 4 [Eremomyces bilateralis CBS 781.70]|uniref:Ferric reductase transmembrane component 4 n=1 Tax=Eremomyces bilateralis CBS 781.70 TaxID=1392243 RepID=A0A6G1G954_9PEZI|nr:ferric reductase transmembrane component 4 [Eremomyces bilateralis CBS 781.70]KAF1814607.1 ferric reductase transmembrane component 4 [Eremomyces bilateralis CBS 781.70]
MPSGHAMDAGGHSHGAAPGPVTTAPCRAADTSFLTTLAYCIKSRCKVSNAEIEKYWFAQVAGDFKTPPKWTYNTTLGNIRGTPKITWASGRTINTTMLVPQSNYNIQVNWIEIQEQNSHYLYKYSIILLVVGFGTPIVTTILSKTPIIEAIIEKLNPYLVYPSIIGRYQVRPLPWLLGNVPTLGQFWYIAMFIILNVVLTCTNYRLLAPLNLGKHPWGYNWRGEILAYVGYRTGEIAFALLPLTILFAGRNNILLWLSNWSHSTYLLLHRWVARLFVVQTVLHSILLWAARVQTGTYAKDVKEPYWLWGIVGTVFCCAMLVFSLLWIRRWSYEIFLIGHIIMAVFTVVGSWYHLVLRFGQPGSHEYWLYAAFAVWAFDRLARVYHIVKNGVKRATVTDIGANHVRVDIPGIRFNGKPGYYGYAYFPTVNPLRPWENHPFSVNSTALLQSAWHRLPSANNSLHGDSPHQHAKQDVKVQVKPVSCDLRTTAGITIYVRRSTGMTRSLQSDASLPTLLDGPYPNNPTEGVLSCDRLVLIGGGIGITGLLSFLHAHVNVKIAWGVKQADEPIVRDLDTVLASVADKEIRIGERLDIDSLLRHEVAAGYKKVGVVVCGPGSLCDDVRAIVASLGRHEKTIVELEVDAFSW